MSGSSESNFDNDNLIEELLIVPGIVYDNINDINDIDNDDCDSDDDGDHSNNYDDNGDHNNDYDESPTM